MKLLKYIFSAVLLTGLLAACENEVHTLSKSEKSIDEQSSQLLLSEAAVAKEGKIEKETDWLKDKSLFQFEAKEGTFKFKVFVYAEDEQNIANSKESGKKPAYKGHYAFYLAENDSADAYKQGALEDLGPFTFQLPLKQAYSLNMGDHTILAILQSDEHGNYNPYLFTIKNGEVVQLHSDSAFGPISDNEMKVIDQEYIQTAYDMGEGNWKFTTWKFDAQTYTLMKADETVLDDKEINGVKSGEYWYNLWSEKKEHYFPFKNLQLSKDVIEKAKQGIPLGNPYPIGTNIENIKKANPDYMEKGIYNNSPYIMYPDITFYYEEDTEIIKAVSIPGERVKTTLAEIEKLFGKPAKIISLPNDAGQQLIYMADKYIIKIDGNAEGKVTAICLQKNI